MENNHLEKPSVTRIHAVFNSCRMLISLLAGGSVSFAKYAKVNERVSKSLCHVCDVIAIWFLS